MRAPLQAPGAAAGQTLRGVHHPIRLQCHSVGRGRRRMDALAVRTVTTHAGTRTAGITSDACDLVLSSGFLAFAGHAGFLQAVEEAGVTVGGVMGTSAGALVGSLYCAGYSPRQLAQHVSDQAPASLLRPSGAPWRGGVLSLDGVIERLRDLLPPRFEDLQREFAVGVVTAEGRHLLIDSGPLPEAVAASAAIPIVFQAVDVPGFTNRHGPFKDGGVVDRVGLKAWRDRRRLQLKKQHQASGAHGPAPRPPPCLVHVIDRSSPFSGLDDTSATGESHIVVVKSPRSGANFFDLGTFEEAMTEATERARPHLAAVALHHRQQRQQHHRQQQQHSQRVSATGHVPSTHRNISSNGAGSNGLGASGSNGVGVSGKASARVTTSGGSSSSNGNGKVHVNGNGVMGGNGVGATAATAAAAAAAAAATTSPVADSVIRTTLL